MTKPVLLAGLLGGFLGGVGGFVLLRSFPVPAKPPAVVETSPVIVAEPLPQSAARPLADQLVAMLKAGRQDEFFARVRPGLTELTDEQFDQFRQEIVAMRQGFAKAYGAPGEFEFARETVVSPSLVRFAYVEKYSRGCVVCFVIFYHSPAGWQVMAFSYHPLQIAFNMLR